ncbi:hypothetical protein N7490_003467 [Penicillium lividum]|nr:hypothetical protein N7490_003467 [Penicillium lividum]
MAITNDTVKKATTGSPQRLLLISVPRTASNLLAKILNIQNQPNVLTNEKGGYFFYSAYMAAAQEGRINKPIDQWTEEEKQEVQSAFQHGLDTLEEYSERAKKENKVMFAKEHAFWFFNPASFDKRVHGTESPEQFTSFRPRIPDVYGASQMYSPSNETVLSDEYLRTWRLAFVIRHPALAWPSMYRAMVKISALGMIDDDGIKGASLTNMSLRWTRMLYDWCMEQPDVPATPLIVDANDVIHSPDSVMRFCELAGLDSGSMQFEWGSRVEEKRSQKWANGAMEGDKCQEDMHKKAAAIMLSTLEDSSGIVKDKAPANIDVSAEATKWKAEFGEEMGGFIEKAVRDSMPDYEYLKARRVTA